MNIHLAVIELLHTDGLTHGINRWLLGHVCFDCVEIDFR